HVPGHSKGSIVLYSPQGKFAIVGDVLFQGSIGRTDLPRGDHATLVNGIRKKLFTLPDETLVLPGHGPMTSIGAEKASNPYVR
ncbi:MAG: MBL fold metallo-hydrolase, partial [Muribaculaceae bacterium]|nr:MBL fold metallo-hydrolase [Muribaculaceae bacterium]